MTLSEQRSYTSELHPGTFLERGAPGSLLRTQRQAASGQWQATLHFFICEKATRNAFLINEAKSRINIMIIIVDISKLAWYDSNIMVMKKGLNKLISECPVCSGALRVTHLRCGDCGTELSGEFTANEFARLPGDKLDFLRVFLACRGNLKEVEAELNISYPTVRSRLDQLLEALTLAGDVEDESAASIDRASVIEALQRGEMTVEEAENELRG